MNLLITTKTKEVIKMDSLKKVLMDRDDMTEKETDEAIQEAKDLMNEYLENDDMCSAFDVCEEMFGLEPDYLEDLLF